MIIELTPKELQTLKKLIKTELVEVKDLINTSDNTADRNDLSNYYDILYMINQKIEAK